MSEALRRKRERQARRLLRVCVPQFFTTCLEEYVDAFEADTLSCLNGDNCALGAMERGDRRADDHIDMRKLHGRAAIHVENIFEGWALFFRTFGHKPRYPTPQWDRLDEGVRRRLIYEACVEELARRNSESVLSPEMRFVEVAP